MRGLARLRLETARVVEAEGEPSRFYLYSMLYVYRRLIGGSDDIGAQASACAYVLCLVRRGSDRERASQQKEESSNASHT